MRGDWLTPSSRCKWTFKWETETDRCLFLATSVVTRAQNQQSTTFLSEGKPERSLGMVEVRFIWKSNHHLKQVPPVLCLPCFLFQATIIFSPFVALLIIYAIPRQQMSSKGNIFLSRLPERGTSYHCRQKGRANWSIWTSSFLFLSTYEASLSILAAD